jgi:hypothetical protein
MSFQAVEEPGKTCLYLPPQAQSMAAPMVADQAATSYLPEETYDGMVFGSNVDPWYTGRVWGMDGYHHFGRL